MAIANKDSQLYRDLVTIRNSDPSGWENEPLPSDYRKHESWAIATFGERTWNVYIRDTWDESEW